MSSDYILTLACQDRVGIVAAVSGALAGIDGFILDSQQYADLETGRFFLRIVFTGQGDRFPASVEGVRAALAEPAARFGFDCLCRRKECSGIGSRAYKAELPARLHYD